jgi:predicted metal-dependent phosphoesterase TrpH
MRVRGDLHIHSVYSDGRAGPKEIILEAIYKELNLISVTDHNTFKGSLATARLAEKMEEAPLVIIGNEVRTVDGDILVYCYEPIDTPRDTLELIDEAHANNCLVVPAHPFDTFRKGIGEKVFDIPGWDAIEVWNASASKGANRRALEAAKILGLPGLANSDAHVPEYIGAAYTVFEVSELTVEGVFEAISSKHVYPFYGRPPLHARIKKLEWSIRRRLLGR